MTEPSGSAASAPDAARVAATLARIRAGVRQQAAWAATAAPDRGNVPVSLANVQAAQQLEQPIPTTHRGAIGWPIVFTKRVVYRLFMKWYLRSVLQQQNAFNRAVTLALQDLYERQRTLTDAIAGGSAVDGSRTAEPR